MEMYRCVYGFESIIVRPYNIYGPAEELTEYRKAVPYFTLAALKGEPLEIFGNGEQTMDAIYLDDAVGAWSVVLSWLRRRLLILAPPDQQK